MLKCENVVKKYMLTTAVDGISLDLEPGKIYALLGPNGSGKTTLMKMIAGLVKPTSGSITYKDQDIGVFSKSEITYMPTESYFYSYMSCEDIGKYYSDFFNDFSLDKYNMLLEKMELNPKAKASKLSSGMMAKLKLAVNLSRDAKLTMLDEPLNGIDIIARDTVINTIIDNFSPEKTFVLSSHLVDELERIIDSAIFIKNGKHVLSGSAEELRQEHGKSIVDLYKDIYGGGSYAKVN